MKKGTIYYPGGKAWWYAMQAAANFWTWDQYVQDATENDYPVVDRKAYEDHAEEVFNMWVEDYMVLDEEEV